MNFVLDSLPALLAYEEEGEHFSIDIKNKV